MNAKRGRALLRVRAERRRRAAHAALLGRRGGRGETRELGDRIETNFYGRRLVSGRDRRGPVGRGALRARAGQPVTLVRADGARGRQAYDRGAAAAASLVSTASLDALRRASGTRGGGRAPLPHDDRDRTESSRTPRTLDRLGRRTSAARRCSSRENVGRCAVTTLDPDTGDARPRHARRDRGLPRGVETAEPLPFGVWCEVADAGPRRGRGSRRGRADRMTSSAAARIRVARTIPPRKGAR